MAAPPTISIFLSPLCSQMRQYITWHVVIVGEVSVEEDPVMSVADVGRVISDHHSVAWTIVGHPLKP